MTAANPIVETIFRQAWSRGDFAHLERVLVDEFTFHVGGNTRRMTVDDMREVISSWRRGFPDLAFEVREVAVGGDLIAARMILMGTHLGEWRGLEATGRRISVDHAFFLRVADGLVVEVWEILDSQALRTQLGT